MRLAQQEQTGKWVVLYADQPIAIEGRMQFDARQDAVDLIAQRGMVVKPDGAIVRPVEPVLFIAPAEPVQAPAKLADNPEPEPVAETQEEPEPVEETAEPAEQDSRRKRGRPRVYSPEEAAQRRREQNRRYYHARREARKAEVAERSKEWWIEHPEKIEEYRNKSNEKRRARYHEDPEYRAKVAAYNREYQAKKRAEREAQAPKE